MNKIRAKQLLESEHCLASIKNMNKVCTKMMAYYKSDQELEFDFKKLNECLTKVVEDMTDNISNHEDKLDKLEKAEEEAEKKQLEELARQQRREVKDGLKKRK